MRANALLAAAVAALLAFPSLSHAARVVVINGDPPGVGFNDPTPATPVGGNWGTTKGEQALIVFQRAADIWGAALDSTVEIDVYSLFAKLRCDATSAVLGSAGAIYVESDFRNAPVAHTWYPVALANKIAGEDLVEDKPNGPEDYAGADIRARFNSGIGAPDCLAGTSWYFGLDTGHAANQINLLTVVLHEMGHGLGFASFANVSTGKFYHSRPDIYSKYYYDFALGKYRVEMSDAERQASAISGQIVWTGDTVTEDASGVLAMPALWIDSPASIAGTYQVGTAGWGAPLTHAGVGGIVAVAFDAANPSGPSTIDACSTITSDVSGKIALAARGTCGFTVKAKNVQNAGAIGLVIVNNNPAVTVPPGLGGSDPTVTIPAISVTYADGVKLLNAAVAGPVQGRIGLDATRNAGTLNGYVKLYSPNPVEPGSSVSHFDVSTYPNQLMEPFINADLRQTVELPYDLTRSLLYDVGWFDDRDLDAVDDAADACFPSDTRATVFLDTVDTGVANAHGDDGCTANDRLTTCSAASNEYVSCVTGQLTTLTQKSDMTAADVGRVVSRAAKR